jgi:hypothetical protein
VHSPLSKREASTDNRMRLIQSLCFALTCLGSADCTAGSQKVSPAQASRPGLASQRSHYADAFLARFGAWGGCGDVGVIDTVANEYIASAVLIRGRCVAEHGDTLSALIAVDTAGHVFLQNSVTDLAYLLRRHPLRRGVAASSVEYALFALKLSGTVPPAATLVRTYGDLPPAVREAARASGFTQPLSRVLSSGSTSQVLVTSVSEGRAVQHMVLVGQNGVIRVIGERTATVAARP